MGWFNHQPVKKNVSLFKMFRVHPTLPLLLLVSEALHYLPASLNTAIFSSNPVGRENRREQMVWGDGKMVQKSGKPPKNVKVTFFKNPCKKMGIFSISTVVSHGCCVFLSLSPFISFMPSSMSWLWRCFLEGLQTDSSHSDIETGINAGVVVVVVGCLLLYQLPHKSTDKTTSKLGGGFKYFVFSPRTLGKGSTSSHIFQMGWFNHQPGKVVLLFFHPNRR